MRHFLRFMLLGTLLFLGKQALESKHQGLHTLTVQVNATASAHEVENAIAEAVLLERALASTNALADPIVREQLLRAMRRDDRASGSDAALISEAVRMGLPRVDPLVRQRLIFQAKQVLRASLRPPTPSRAELEAYLAEHRERYEIPPRLTFWQVFISRARHEGDLEVFARKLQQRLPELNLDAQELKALSDPSLLPVQLTEVSETDVAARFGPELARAVFETEALTFFGPVSSSYGLHFLRVTEREPAELPALSHIRARVEADFLHDRTERDVERALRDLERTYDVRVLRSAS